MYRLSHSLWYLNNYSTLVSDNHSSRTTITKRLVNTRKNEVKKTISVFMGKRIFYERENVKYRHLYLISLVLHDISFLVVRRENFWVRRTPLFSLLSSSVD